MEKVAICITTRNRPESFAKVYESCIKYGHKVFVVDDASDTVYHDADYRFNERVGIPRAKNKCIELAMDYGAEHIFLLDDDAIIISYDFIERYINSGYNHLCYTFLMNYKTHRDIKVHALGNGCAMYMRKICFDTIGGFDTSYGLGKYEHTCWSHRCFNAGLTPYVYIDLIDSKGWVKCLDENNEIKRSFNPKEMSFLLKNGYKNFLKNIKTSKYIDYK